MYKGWDDNEAPLFLYENEDNEVVCNQEGCSST